ncbi:putative carbohydrate esterase [Hibiscus syriacus]|uniref:Carbohydrate esterase n=1 Tax=Hibiscus syriacus TaxID=106335 RepID=A0A6A2YTV0_HIBSY|nr:putative carbohydrate esterase [Hibiscus syriacus]
MAGRGGVTYDISTGIQTWDGVVPTQCQPDPSILRLSADLAWVPAREPIHADIDARMTDGIGPGMSFANAVLTKDPNSGPIGLVPCAVGGTAINQWQKGEFLYEQLVKRAQMAQQSGGVYRAMLWYQGEADTLSQEDAQLYEGRLKTFFNDLRSDLQTPTLPIFQLALASGEGPYIEEVREGQLNINLQNVKCVDAKGLPLEPDRLHLTTQAQVRLGEMLADVYLGFMPTSSTTNNAPPTSFSTSVPRVLIIAQIFRCLWMFLTF